MNKFVKYGMFVTFAIQSKWFYFVFGATFLLNTYLNKSNTNTCFYTYPSINSYANNVFVQPEFNVTMLLEYVTY